MWDNRLSKRNPKAPDFKCRKRECAGSIWPASNGGARNGGAKQAFNLGDELPGEFDEQPFNDDSEIPF